MVDALVRVLDFGPGNLFVGDDRLARERTSGAAERGADLIVQGALGGIVAAFAYDLFRLPFVLAGAPLFTVFARFGELLLGATEPRWLVQALGWSYHFSNGAALGIMFLALVTRPTPRALFWGAVGWALLVEAMLLLTPYAPFFGLPLNGQFIALTVSAHLVFGVALGLWCRHRVSEPSPLPPEPARQA